MADLAEFPAKITEQEENPVKYIFLMIDVVSRYCFYTILRYKRSKNIQDGFRKILTEIKEFRRDSLFTSQEGVLT